MSNKLHQWENDNDEFLQELEGSEDFTDYYQMLLEEREILEAEKQYDSAEKWVESFLKQFD